MWNPHRGESDREGGRAGAQEEDRRLLEEEGYGRGDRGDRQGRERECRGEEVRGEGHAGERQGQV